MPRRDREINIFNIAFLDVITGAMGAFILLVLLLAPYYTGPQSPPPHLKKVQQSINDAAKSTEHLEKQIDQAVKAGIDPKLFDALKKLLARVKSELAAAQRQMISLRGEINGLEKKNHELIGQNQQLQAELSQAKSRISQLKQEIQQLQSEIQQLKAKIRYLEQHQGTAKFRPMVVFVEREHIPNGLLNSGAPFMVYARTLYRSGVAYTTGKGTRSLPAQNDPPFAPEKIRADHFNLPTWVATHIGRVPFPRGKGVDDEQFFTPRVNNGPGYSTSSPNTEELVIADANLRSHISLYVLLTPPHSPKMEKHGQFAITITFGKQSLTKHFVLSYAKPIRKYSIQILPGENMIIHHFPLAGTGIVRSWSARLAQ